MKTLSQDYRRIAKERILKRASDDFPYFFRVIFPKSFKTFVVGGYVDDIASFMQSSNKTIRVGPRDHIKSTSFYAHFMWKLLQARYSDNDLECHYFSYKDKMATYHIGGSANTDNIKALIARNPYFTGVNDLKVKSEGMGLFQWAGSNNVVSLSSAGLLTFTRGIHTKGIVYVDDPLQDEDPTTKLDPTKVRTINNRIMASIYSMPQFEQGAELHFVGTPQTEEDFYFNPKFTKQFSVRFDKAVVNEENHEVLFPEWRSYEWLLEKRESIGEKLFLQEYMCTPTHTLDSYIIAEHLDKCIDPSLINGPEEINLGEYDTVVGGLDIGKHQHPSHLTFHLIRENGDRIQLLSKWMDGWDYTDQIEEATRYGELYACEFLYYDDTRGEFESLQETGELPTWFVPVNLASRKKRFDYARAFSQKLENDTIKLLADERQRRQMLVVDGDLKARETSEGHGDCFWSNVCCMEYDRNIGTYIGFV